MAEDRGLEKRAFFDGVSNGCSSQNPEYSQFGGAFNPLAKVMDDDSGGNELAALGRFCDRPDRARAHAKENTGWLAVLVFWQSLP
jgi:hypothetical protein